MEELSKHRVQLQSLYFISLEIQANLLQKGLN